MRANKAAMLRATVKDSRGKVVALVPQGLGAAFGDASHRERLQKAADQPREKLTRGEIWRGIGYGALALPLLVAAAMAPAVMTSALKLPWWALALAVVPLGMVPALVTVFVSRRSVGRRIAGIYSKAELCASCGFDLRALPTEADGCRICPECGAAWRVG